MDSAATRCPHCQTRFRVTEAQLKTARGLVRCGACLEVFDATEHWVTIEADELPVTPDPPEPQAQVQPAPEQAEADEPHEPISEGESGADDIEEPMAEAPASFGPEVPVQDRADHEIAGEAAAQKEANDAATKERIAPDNFDALVARNKRPLAIGRRQLAWGALSLLAALALLAQVIYVNFVGIAQSNYRPQLAKTCEAANFFLGEQYCNLPPAQNLALIRSRGLNIFSHPEYAESLMVDALIVNTASFAQPFPVIELLFRDRNGRTVAARRFLPEEYLGGELTGTNRMPSQQPVHIAIAILDPGASAVNYEMVFHPAPTAAKDEAYTG